MPQVFDPVAQFAGVSDVSGRDSTDALRVNPFELQRHTERDGSEDGQFMRRIDAFDVESRISLRITLALRFVQHGLEFARVFAHFRKHVVAGSVDDAGQPLDIVASQAFADRLDNGNTASHSALESDHHTTFARRREYLVPVQGDQGLVCGNHVFALFDRRHHQGQRRVLAADQFDHDRDVGITHHVPGIGTYASLSKPQRLGALLVARRVGDHNAASGASRYFLGVTLQHGDGSTTHGSQPQQAYFYRLHR